MIRMIRFCLVCLLCCLIPSRSSAVDGEVALTFKMMNQLAEEARTNNPSILAALARVRSAQEEVSSIRVWQDPMFELGGAIASGKGPMISNEGDLIYRWTQNLPLFGRPRLEKNVATNELALEKINAEYAFQTLRRDLVRQLLSTAQLERQVDIAREDLSWLKTMVENTEQKYQTGTAALSDVLQVQNEYSKRADALQTLSHLVLAEQRMLNRFLNRDLSTVWPRLALPAPANPIQFSPKLVDLSLKYELRLKILEQEIRKAEAKEQLTRRKRLPETSFSVEGRQYSGDGGFREGMFGIGLSLPWVNLSKYRAEEKREKAAKEAAEFEKKDYELSLRQEIYRLTTDIDAARREAVLYQKEINPRNRQALAAAQQSWAVNRGTLREVLEIRRMLLDGQGMEARAIAEQYRLLADLVLCCGLADLEALDMLKDLKD